MLGLRGAAIDEVGGIGLVRIDDGAQADAKQPVSCAVAFAFQETARRGKYPLRQLRWRLQRARPGADLEIRGLELQRDGRAGERLGLQTRRNLLGQVPQDALERAEARNV